MYSVKVWCMHIKDHSMRSIAQCWIVESKIDWWLRDAESYCGYTHLVVWKNLCILNINYECWPKLMEATKKSLQTFDDNENITRVTK